MVEPRTRSRSAHLPTHIPIASKAVRPRAKSVQKTYIKSKSKGTGKGNIAKKKSGKAVVVVRSDLEDLEVDFPHHPPNQPQDIPAEQPQEPNPPVNIPSHPYVLLDRNILCNCDIEAGSNFLLESLATCEEHEKPDLEMYFTVNLAFVDYLEQLNETITTPRSIRKYTFMKL